MGKYNGPKCRLCRREGIKLYLKGERCESQKCAIVRKNYAPGQHGNKNSFSKKSEYAKQLRAKQQGRRIFNIGERQFEAYYVAASKTSDITSEALLKLLETRLDNVLYRSGIAASRSQARQLISHGLIQLNNKKVYTPSIQVKINDKFEVCADKKEAKIFADLSNKKPNNPAWLQVDNKKLSGQVIRKPEKSELESSISGHLIVEYYSK